MFVNHLNSPVGVEGGDVEEDGAVGSARDSEPRAREARRAADGDGGPQRARHPPRRLDDRVPDGPPATRTDTARTRGQRGSLRYTGVSV